MVSETTDEEGFLRLLEIAADVIAECAETNVEREAVPVFVDAEEIARSASVVVAIIIIMINNNGRYPCPFWAWGGFKATVRGYAVHARPGVGWKCAS
jgi:hypothetical protein